MRSSQWLKRVSYFVFLLAASWCVMTVVHEAGHIVCGWAGGGMLRDADLAPWHLPHSSFDPDPYPLATVWGGPVLGALVPVAAAALIRRGWMSFIAYFCVLANGSYLATAWVSGERYLDTPKLLEHGAHPVTVGVYCVSTIAVGYLGFRRQCIHVLSAKEPGSDLQKGAQPTAAADTAQSGGGRGCA
ncbi:hypothetical protein [Fimbriiglobus ruber]|uniref:Uncharacterized protein n=1 Tax=Fimbriiglobus ruber TaxID=1908690 RepID=A0A225E0H6_9BACT|nr:hypothetical protein [Fimbriiglobus ruber]OWK41857.1 hypothetical protein FRUB_03935 [Fimbriiglobus ruber]